MRIEDPTPPLYPILKSPRALAKEANSRKLPVARISVSKGEVGEYLQNGWSIDRELKQRVRLTKPLPHDEQLENRVWLLLYRMGYHELSSGRNFTIEIVRKGIDVTRKQIDVLAKDAETIIVAECKSSEDIRRRSLQKDIDEFASLKGAIATAIEKSYGKEAKLKIIWMFFTKNIIWSEPDKLRASTNNIVAVTERELAYYLQIADHLRDSARYQFLGECLKGQKVQGLENKKVPAIRGKLGGKKFYCFVAKPEDLLKIAFINHRSLNDPEGAPTYQRLVGRTRLKQIRTFIEKGGYFPNNLLINFNQPVPFEVSTKANESGISFGLISLPNRYRSAWVIDGQHRLYGYSGIPKRSQEANLIVVAFESLPKETEANLFVTINHEQKTVPKTLLDDLEGELKWGSDVPSERVGSMGARLVGLLNRDIGEPFYNRVAQQGIRPTHDSCLTVPSFKDGLKRTGLLGRAQFNNKEFQPGPLTGTNDYETVDRARRALNVYFGIIKTSNERLWNLGRESVICTNPGIFGFLLLFSELISYMEGESALDSRHLDPETIVEEISLYLDPITKWLSTNTPSTIESFLKVPYGSGGPPEYYHRLVSIIQDVFADFIPEGFDDWKLSRSEERIQNADSQIKQINVMVQKAIFDKLRAIYGESSNEYWEKGVKDSKIKVRAYEKSLEVEVGDRLGLEHYLDFIEYKKIVENKENWAMFKDVFDLPIDGDKGNAKNLKWMDKINELRRISAHPTDKRSYKSEDLEFIEWVHDTLSLKLGLE